MMKSSQSGLLRILKASITSLTGSSKPKDDIRSKRFFSLCSGILWAGKLGSLSGKMTALPPALRTRSARKSLVTIVRFACLRE